MKIFFNTRILLWFMLINTFFQTLPAQTYSPIPYYEGFEKPWMNKDGYDVPSVFWKNTPASGTTSWIRTLPGADGSSVCAGFNASSSNKGYLDLYLDFSSAGENMMLSFYYYNMLPDPPSHMSLPSTAGRLNGYLSEDGGLTFAKTLFNLYGMKSGWSKIVIDLGALKSPVTVVRFEGVGGAYNPWSNILIDNVSVFPKFQAEYTYTSFPYTESFTETWKVYDSTYAAPSRSWKNTPLAASYNVWRKSENSARFFDFNNENRSQASLDLYVDFSKYKGNKFLSFRNFIDPTDRMYHFTTIYASGILSVYLSTDEGKNFTLLYRTQASNLEDPVFVDLQKINIPGIIRFEAQSDGPRSFCEIILKDIKLGNVKADFSADTLAGTVPLTVNFTNRSFGDSVLCKWDFNNDGIIDGTGQTQSFTYKKAGLYSVKLIAEKDGYSDTLVKSGYIRAFDSPQYAILPYHEDFDSTWISMGSLRDVPSENWRNIPYSGVNSWSREDDGVSRGAWNFISGLNSGMNGTHSACFQSSTTDLSGSLDLFADFSSCAGSKGLSFWYKNLKQEGDYVSRDSLKVYLSTDGGKTFDEQLLSLGENKGWEKIVTGLENINASEGVIRFKAYGDLSGRSDIQVDDVNIGSLVANFTADVIYGALPLTVHFSNKSIGNISSYKWDFNGDKIIESTEPDPSFTFKSIGTYTVKLIVSNSTQADSIIKTDYVNVDAYASLPFHENFESEWINRDYTRDVPSIFWKTHHNFGDNFWARDDDSQFQLIDWQKYSPGGANGSHHSARSFSSRGGRDHTIDLYVDFSSMYGKKFLSFWYINTNGEDSLKISLSDDAGKTFSSPVLSLGVKQVWTKVVVNLENQDSRYGLIRFVNTPGWVVGNQNDTSDIGLDEVNIECFMADFSADVTTGAMPLTVHFLDQSAGNPVSREWDFNDDGLVDEVMQNPSYTYSKAGVYTVRLKVSREDYCDSIKKLNYIKVTDGDDTEPPEQPSEYATVYPNPTIGTVNVKFSNPENEAVTFELIDVNGRIVHLGKAAGSEYSIDLNGYEKGVYYLQTSFGNKVLYNKILKN